MNKAGMTIGAVALATLGVIAGKSQSLKMQEVKPFLEKECTFVEPLKADVYVKNAVKDLAKKI